MREPSRNGNRYWATALNTEANTNSLYASYLRIQEKVTKIDKAVLTACATKNTFIVMSQLIA